MEGGEGGLGVVPCCWTSSEPPRPVCDAAGASVATARTAAPLAPPGGQR